MIKIQNKYSYSEDDLIGEGAYSKVYKGLIDKTQEFVAIKVIDWSKVQDKYYVSGFQREVRILRDLDHQNIVKIIEMFHDAGQNREYLIMEYCDSQNLKYFLFQSGGVLSENVTKIVLQQLLTALNELIKKEYLHRDIKPENILIHQRTLKLADFGFSVKADYSGNQLFRENVGTPLYMAPQILENKHYSTKCDIWSIGIMTYQLITGDYPWMGDDPTQLLKSIKSQKLSFPLQIQISQEFKEFIINCLQFEEKDRYNWDDLLDHKIFKTKYVIQKNQIKIEQLQLAIDEIRQVQKKRGTPVEQLFTNLDMDGDKKLTFEEFQALLLYVDKQMEINIQKGIFYKYNVSKNNLLNFNEFSRIFH
ncbi:unnamed protein product [Paramecium octaurelia]|uniref:Calcium-dependent protein kinase n=1 Tax=Paramecium octaurelia TaxID=43137 RepID=A0A8S1VJI0_PAROT|nr:unnamed protein product [Paramecium octaurelia]